MSQQNSDVQFVGLAAQDSEEAMQNFVNTFGVGVFPNVNDASGELWARFGIAYQPAFVLLRADGTSETFASLSESDLQGHIDRIFSPS